MSFHAHLRSSLSTTRAVLANPDLRRVQLALSLTATSTPAYAIALAVYAYGHGGAAAVGIVGLVALLPAALAAPFAAHLADRHRRERVMFWAALIRGTLMALGAVALLLDFSPYTIYGLAVLASIPSRVFFPAQAALVPTLTRTPRELTAANAFASTIESVGGVLGPALAGVLLAVDGPLLAYALAAAGTLSAAALISRVRAPEQPDERPEEHRAKGVLGGFRTIRDQAQLRLLVGLFVAQTFVYGVFTVLLVVVAFELAELGGSGVGLLEGAVGVGGVLAGLAILGLKTERHSSRLKLGLVLWGLPLVVVGVSPAAALALAMFALIGAGNTLFDVSTFTLIQEACPEGVRARVFGILESLAVGAVAFGSLLAPLSIALVGSRATLIVAGAALAALPFVATTQLSRVTPARPLAAQPAG